MTGVAGMTARSATRRMSSLAKHAKVAVGHDGHTLGELPEADSDKFFDRLSANAKALI